jgi:hypothetical protein
MHLAQSHLGEQIQVEGELSEIEREGGILDVASLKLEITAFKIELLALKKNKRGSYRRITQHDQSLERDR